MRVQGCVNSVVRDNTVHNANFADGGYDGIRFNHDRDDNPNKEVYVYDNHVIVDTTPYPRYGIWESSTPSVQDIHYGENYVTSNVQTSQTSLVSRGVKIGTPSSAGDQSVAIGMDVDGSGDESIAIGYIAGVPANYAVAVGRGASIDSTAAQAIAIGWGATIGANADGAVAIGKGCTVNTAEVARIGGRVSQLVFKAVRDTIADADLNNSELTIELDETNAAFRLRGKDSNGNIQEATVAW